MLYRDRLEAGHLLARALHKYKGHSPLILAIPRGAVPMGRQLATELGGELDVVMVRKIGAPYQPEYALGAVDEGGWMYRNPWAGDDPATLEYMETERAAQLKVMQRRRELYTPGRPPVDPKGRIVIVVDDGLATGSTMIAALHALQGRHPAKLICAIPVAPPDVLAKLGTLANEVVCLQTPVDFHAVGQFYARFDQVEDEQVVEALRSPTGAAPASAEEAAPAVLKGGAVRMALADVVLEGELHPGDGQRVVVFAHGSGSSRHSPRNRYVAQVLNQAGMGTLLFDMLTLEEDREYERRFDIELLTQRLTGAVAWLRQRAPHLSIALFGASTGAAAALQVAAQLRPPVDAVVSRGGRPDLAGVAALRRVKCPTLLIVGSLDTEVLALNREALAKLGSVGELVEIPGATHLFEEAGTLEQVADIACGWLGRQLSAAARPS